MPETHIVDITPGIPVRALCGMYVCANWNDYNRKADAEFATGKSTKRGLLSIEAATPQVVECGTCAWVWQNK